MSNRIEDDVNNDFFLFKKKWNYLKMENFKLMKIFVVLVEYVYLYFKI